LPLELTLPAWLARLEQLHSSTIELGLDRVRRVKDALALSPTFPILTVGGTNGKGSTCAYLEAMLTAAGYKTGLYTSPHLLRYNERVRIAESEADAAGLVAAFERIDAARGDTSLTYFEFGTLGAMLQFVEAGVDVAILEVGLGGRLDAVNVFDADAAIVTSIDLDHQDYLGDTREAIGFEKAGIYRAGRPAICADPAPPASLLRHAQAIGAGMRRFCEDFSVEHNPGAWRYRGQHWTLSGLPLPAMAGGYQVRNAAGAIALLESLRERLPVDERAIKQGLGKARVPGRFQRLGTHPEVILDVAHNPEAARALAATLREYPIAGRTLAVAGMLADKDVAGVIAALSDCVDDWFVCTPASPRALPATALAECIRHVANAAAVIGNDPRSAFAAAQEQASLDDRIVAFGSFYTVSALLNHASSSL
jgi:dihydrofolate synthase/folylpolyglutamate synthase